MNPVALLVEESLCIVRQDDDDDYDGKSRICQNLRSFGIRIVLSVSVFFVAVYIPYFADVVAFIGAFCSCFVSLVFPCAAYLQIFNIRNKLARVFCQCCLCHDRCNLLHMGYFGRFLLQKQQVKKLEVSCFRVKIKYI